MKAEAPTVLARCQHRSRTYFAIIWDWNGLPAIVQRSNFAAPAITPSCFPPACEVIPRIELNCAPSCYGK